MGPSVPTRRLLLAGSVGPERLPVRPDPADPRWFEPLHVRDERTARERIASQVAVGADIVVAPTWRTHRRALLSVGETRQARAWTTTAVRIAREGVELSLERRAERTADGDEPDGRTAAEPTGPGDPGGRWGPDGPGRPSGPGRPDGLDRPRGQDRPAAAGQHRGVDLPDRPHPLVAATLPALDEDPEPGTGRLLPRAAATERDYRDQAGLLADSTPDLLLVEGQHSLAEARSAVIEAVQTGLPVWAAATMPRAGTNDLEGWLEWSQGQGVACLLLPPPPSSAGAAATGLLPWGGLARDATETTAWLEAGASVIARLNGATARALEALRAAIDAHEWAGLQAGRQAEQRWTSHVHRAASMAPGGAALWLGPRPAAPLPGGFDWMVVEGDELLRLPEGRFRLIVASMRAPGATSGRAPASGAEALGSPAPAEALGRLLEHGGIVALPIIGGLTQVADLRPLLIDDADEPPLAILRREA